MWLLAAFGIQPVDTAPRRVRIDGMALTPHFEDPAKGLEFDVMVDEVAALGASHLSVVVQWAQRDIWASQIGPHAKETQSEAVVRRIIRRARTRGLKVMVFPILWVEHRGDGEWRGTLRPRDLSGWWRSYRRFILHFAKLAAEEGATVFSVGSELGSMEGHGVRWVRLIADVREVFSGQLIYSANWDHYEAVEFWPMLDLVGMTAYYRLSTRADASLDELRVAWRGVHARLMRFSRRIDRPIVFTELGYPSADGAATRPWDYTTGRSVDLEEQRRCYQAFFDVWRDEPSLGGVFFWNWWGPGGPADNWYTIKGKPAEEVVRRWYARPGMK